MSDNVAVLAGFTQQLVASAGLVDLFILVRPDTDLDSRFEAWDSDTQEFIRVNGWMCTFETMQ